MLGNRVTRKKEEDEDKGKQRIEDDRGILGRSVDRCVYLLVLIFGGQSFLQLLLCVGVDDGAVCRPHIVPLTHP